MTENDFVRMVATNAKFNYVDAEVFFAALEKSINECVEKRESFKILNFGVLEFSKVKARKSSKLLGSKELPETERIYFHLSNNLKKLMKNSKK